MNPLLQTIITGFMVALISVLLTYVFTNIANKETQKKSLKNKVDSAIVVHKQIDHPKSIFQVVEEHEDKCEARNDIGEVKECITILRTGVIFLVKEHGGNPRDLGLIK